MMDGDDGIQLLGASLLTSTPWKLNTCAVEGYAGNPVVFSCINIIANACASVKLEVHKPKANGEFEILDKHKLIDLLKHPNPPQTGKAFIREVSRAVVRYLRG